MPSPFPCMDPYLEGHLWPDVHQRLATEISRRLAPRLRPRYVARLAVQIIEEWPDAAESKVMYPDVEVLLTGRPLREPGPVAVLEPTPTAEHPTITPAPLQIPIVQVRVVTVEIRDTADNDLITSIEILSPVNKREPGLSQYRRKQQRLQQANVHLLEIDLLRRGTRPFNHPRIPKIPYLITLTRAEAGRIELWPIGLPDPLPTLPVPLRPPDPDVPLELGPALATIYEEAVYELSIDYHHPPPPPPLTEPETEWLQNVIRQRSENL